LCHVLAAVVGVDAGGDVRAIRRPLGPTADPFREGQQDPPGLELEHAVQRAHVTREDPLGRLPLRAALRSAHMPYVDEVIHRNLAPPLALMAHFHREEVVLAILREQGQVGALALKLEHRRPPRQPAVRGGLGVVLVQVVAQALGDELLHRAIGQENGAPRPLAKDHRRIDVLRGREKGQHKQSKYKEYRAHGGTPQRNGFRPLL
jgi:hypothetical protein